MNPVPRRYHIRPLMILIAVAAVGCAEFTARQAGAGPTTGGEFATFVGSWPDYNGLDEYSVELTQAPLALGTLGVGLFMVIRRFAHSLAARDR